MGTKDKIEILPTAEKEVPTEQALDICATNLENQFDLKEGTTLGQTAIWLKSKDFENHAEALLMHFADRLRIYLVMNNLLGEPLVNCIGKPNLTDETTWGEINKVIMGILEGSYHGGNVEMTQDQLALIFGFPEGKYEDTIDCIENGVRMEIAE